MSAVIFAGKYCGPSLRHPNIISLSNSTPSLFSAEIGIISLKLVQEEVEGMGFAIPIEDALSVAEQLEKNGKVVRPMLGVSTTSVEGAEYYNIYLPDNITYGAVVEEVMGDSNASRAGIRKGDVIIKCGDYKVEDYQYLQYYLYRYQVGDTIEITLIRDGKERVIEVELKG